MKNLVNVFQDTLENSKGLTKSTTSKHTLMKYIMLNLECLNQILVL
jgi:hypothetical protein